MLAPPIPIATLRAGRGDRLGAVALLTRASRHGLACWELRAATHPGLARRLVDTGAVETAPLTWALPRGASAQLGSIGDGPTSYPWQTVLNGRQLRIVPRRSHPRLAGVTVTPDGALVADGDVAAVLAAAHRRKIPVTCETAADVDALDAVLASIVIDVDPHAPGRLRAAAGPWFVSAGDSEDPAEAPDRTAGPDVATVVSTLWDEHAGGAAQLDDRVHALEDVGPVHVTDRAAALAAVADAGGIGRACGRGQLHWWQDRYREAYHASVAGLVCAFDVGLGKTVASLAAFAHAAGADRWCGLVLAPATTVRQWADEAAVWLDGTAIVTITATTGADLAAAVAAARDGARTLVVTTPELAAGHYDALTTIPWDDLCVDEGAWLRNSRSRRSRTAAAVRAVARRASILSGTPSGVGGDRDLAHLVAFVAGQPVPARPRDDLGPWIHGDDLTRASVGLGAVTTSTIPVTAADVDLVVLGAARRELERRWAAWADVDADLAGRSAGTKKARQLRRLRAQLAVGVRAAHVTYRRLLADPGLLEGTSTAVRAARDAGVPAHRPPDRLSAVAASVEAGERAVAATDFVTVADRFVAAAAGRAQRLAPAGAGRDTQLDAWRAGRFDIVVIGGGDSRGTNLQDAHTVIHLDPPANAADAIQRVGRVSRLGGTGGRAERFPVTVGGDGAADGYDHWAAVALRADTVGDAVTGGGDGDALDVIRRWLGGQLSD